MIFIGSERDKNADDNVWSLKELRAAVKSKVGNPHQIISVINSIHRLSGVFIYHLEQARESINNPDFFDSEDGGLRFVVGSDSDQENFQTALLINEANTISLLYTVRSLYDIFSQLLNSLVLNGKYRLHECDIKRVYEDLSESEIKQLLAKLLSSYEFKYIDGFVNCSKHRHLVAQNVYFSFGDGRSGVKFSNFSYKGEPYSEQWSEDILHHAVYVKNHIRMLGCLLNKEYI